MQSTSGLLYTDTKEQADKEAEKEEQGRQRLEL